MGSIVTNDNGIVHEIHQIVVRLDKYIYRTYLGIAQPNRSTTELSLSPYFMYDKMLEQLHRRQTVRIQYVQWYEDECAWGRMIGFEISLVTQQEDIIMDHYDGHVP